MDPIAETEDRSASTAMYCIIGVLFLAWGMYVLVVLGLLLGHYHWLMVHVPSLDRPVLKFCGFAVVPLCLLLSLSPRTRLLSGMLFFIVSGIFTFAICSYCAIFVYSLWSWWGVVLGTAMVGYGIMPVAALAAFSVHPYQWWIIRQVVSGGIMMFSCLYFGLVLMTMAVSGHAARGKQMPSDIDLPSNSKAP